MKIEDYWQDTEVYYIQFQTSRNQKVSKMIVVDAGHSMEEVENIILSKFNQIKEVVILETVGESLSLKPSTKPPLVSKER